MKQYNKQFGRGLMIGLLGLMSLVLLAVLWKASLEINLGGGEGDFVAYWSATALLRDGLNPYDPVLMRGVLETLMPMESDYIPMAWNPPFLFIFLLGLTLTPYRVAKFVWMLCNIAMIAGGSLMLARVYFPSGKRQMAGLFLLFAFSLPPVVAGLFVGQVTFLVFLGTVGCLVLMKKEKWFWAGAILILTTIKPHMVMLVLIYLLLVMARRRHYQGWVGLAAAGLTCIAALFILRPEWVSDLLGLMRIAPVNWDVPTIGGLINHYAALKPARYMIVLLLPLPVILARYGPRIKIEFAVALLTLITVPCTFFGWSFDQVLLLIPAAQVFCWVAGLKKQGLRAGFAIVIVSGVVVYWILRILNTNEVFYVWYPLYWWLLFGAAWYFSRAGKKTEDEALRPIGPAGRGE